MIEKQTGFSYFLFLSKIRIAAGSLLLLLLLALALLMSTQKVQFGGQFNRTKLTRHHAPLRQHVQEASCGGVQDMRRRGPYGQDVWSP